MTRITAGKFVRFEYTLTDEDGDVLQKSDEEGLEPLQYVHGYSPLLSGLHDGLAGLAEGETKRIVVTPENGYGEHDEDGVFQVPRSELPNPDTVAFGDEFEAEDEDGNVLDMHVVEVSDDTVVVDANHPLAGVTLTWEVSVLEVRDATKDEMSQARTQAAEARADSHTHDPNCQH